MSESLAAVVDSLSSSDRFRDFDTLGEGGQATTFRSHWGPGSEKIPVVVKVFREDRKEGNGRCRRFYHSDNAGADNEPEMLQRTGDLLDWGATQDHSYVVTPYKEGETLADYLEENDPTEADFKQVFSDLAQELQGIHDRGVVHRDLNPNNVLYDGESASIIDFGVASEPDDESKPVPTAGSVNVTDWTLFEEFTDSPRPYDEAADQYSLGALMMYFAQGGQHVAEFNPDRGRARDLLRDTSIDTNNGVDRQSFEGCLDEAVSQAPDWFDDYAHIAKQAMQSDADQRFRDVNELDRAVDRAGRTWSDTMTSWRKTGAAVLLGLATIAGGLGYGMSSSDQRFDVRSSSEAVGEQRSTFVNPEVSAMARGSDETYIDGEGFVEVSPGSEVSLTVGAEQIGGPNNQTAYVIGDAYVEGFEPDSGSTDFRVYPKSDDHDPARYMRARKSSWETVDIPEGAAPGMHYIAVEFRKDKALTESIGEFDSSWDNVDFGEEKIYSRERVPVWVGSDSTSPAPHMEGVSGIPYNEVSLTDRRNVEYDDESLTSHVFVAGHAFTSTSKSSVSFESVVDSLRPGRYVSQVTTTAGEDTVGTYYVPFQVERLSESATTLEPSEFRFEDRERMMSLRQEQYAAE